MVKPGSRSVCGLTSLRKQRPALFTFPPLGNFKKNPPKHSTLQVQWPVLLPSASGAGHGLETAPEAPMSPGTAHSPEKGHELTPRHTVPTARVPAVERPAGVPCTAIDGHLHHRHTVVHPQVTQGAYSKTGRCCQASPSMKFG